MHDCVYVKDLETAWCSFQGPGHSTIDRMDVFAPNPAVAKSLFYPLVRPLLRANNNYYYIIMVCMVSFGYTNYHGECGESFSIAALCQYINAIKGLLTQR